MSRGRQSHPARATAREAGEKFYIDDHDCDFCGTNRHYVSNGACVACSVARGNARYAAQDEEARAAQRVYDREKYLRRKAE